MYKQVRKCRAVGESIIPSGSERSKLSRKSSRRQNCVTSIMADIDTEPMSRLLKIANRFNCFYLSGIILLINDICIIIV